MGLGHAGVELTNVDVSKTKIYSIVRLLGSFILKVPFDKLGEIRSSHPKPDRSSSCPRPFSVGGRVRRTILRSTVEGYLHTPHSISKYPVPRGFAPRIYMSGSLSLYK